MKLSLFSLLWSVIQYHFLGYSVKNPDKKIYSALVYPTTEKRDDNIVKGHKFGGESGTGTRFNVLTIKEPGKDPGDKNSSGNNSMLNSEKDFIKDLKNLIGESIF